MDDARPVTVLGRSDVRSREERSALGRARRNVVRLDEHAAVPSPPDRPDPVDVLSAQDAARVPELVPIRHGRMNANPFTFYRGASAVMAADLASRPSSDITVQLCGDAHVSNFGVFHTPDRRLVFDLDDFDETHPGPFEWDVKRLAASVAVAGRNNGLGAARVERAVRAAVKGYRRGIARLATEAPLTVHHRRVEVDDLEKMLGDKHRKQMAELRRRAARKNSLRALDRLTTVVDGRRAIVPDPPLITRIDDGMLAEEVPRIAAFLDRYRASLSPWRRRLLDQYSVVDVARKVVGVGSVGTRCLVVLLEGGDGEPLFLQLKEATASVLERYLGQSEHEPGERVVLGQRQMQTLGDVLLGWSHVDGPEPGATTYFYVRQLWDGKGSIDVDELGGGGLRRYGRMCGRVLALAHARSGAAATIAGYLGVDDTFDRAICEFSDAYADLNEADHLAHRAAIEGGRMSALDDIAPHGSVPPVPVG